MARKHLTQAEAAEKGWYSRKELKALFRLKPARAQQAAGSVWQGMFAYRVYDKTLCSPMRNYRAPNDRQRAALARGREMLGTVACVADGCVSRYERGSWKGPLCPSCEERERRAQCAATARRWLDDSCIVLDVETTGLSEDAEIVEISVVDAGGGVLLDTLIRPRSPIPQEVAAIHGITDTDVAQAPSWAEVYERFCRAIDGRLVAIYNADFDLRLLHQTAMLHGVSPPNINAVCAMRLYAQWFGELRRDGDFRWQTLGAAAGQCGIEVDGAHRGRADCLTTLRIINYIAAKEA